MVIETKTRAFARVHSQSNKEQNDTTNNYIDFEKLNL